MGARIDCPVCGYSYDPVQHTSCAGCPLNGGCQLSCCPNCGYQSVDPGRSPLNKLVRGWGRFRRKRRHSLWRDQPDLSLIDLPPGSQSQVVGFLPGVPAARQTALQAYGICPGTCITVLCHSPVTVVLVDQTELALEHELARTVLVQPIRLFRDFSPAQGG